MPLVLLFVLAAARATVYEVGPGKGCATIGVRGSLPHFGASRKRHIPQGGVDSHDKWGIQF